MSDPDPGAPGAGSEIGAKLRHDDPSQLWFQIEEIVNQRTYLRHGIEVGPGDTVVDAGANVGIAAAFFALECRAGRVLCFEPVAPIAAMLRANTDAIEAVEVFEHGLDAREREADITYYAGAAAMSGLYADPEADREFVRGRMLAGGFSAAEAEAELGDRYRPEVMRCRLRPLSTVIGELRLERIHLLKIDVEGAELDVLSGIEDGDWQRIAQVAIEVHDRDGRLRTVRDLLERHGFEVVAEQEPAMRDTAMWMAYARRR